MNWKTFKEKVFRGFKKDIAHPFGEKLPVFPVHAPEEDSKMGEKKPAVKFTKYRQMARRPAEGKTWNPIKKYPVNHPCYCGSALKAKKCCLPYLNDVCSEQFAKEMKLNWRKILSGQMTLPRAPRNRNFQ